MSDFDTLVTDAQPELFIASAQAQEGMSWDFSVRLLDGDGVEYDLPTVMSGGTAVCEVLDKIDGDVLVTMSVTFPGDGEIRWTASPSDTAGLGGTSKTGRRVRWYMTWTNSAGRKVSVFGPQDSILVIKQGA